jgi:hypothetical protein
MPAIIAATKIKAGIGAMAKSARAGPGQSPDIPQTDRHNATDHISQIRGRTTRHIERHRRSSADLKSVAIVKQAIKIRQA